MKKFFSMAIAPGTAGRFDEVVQQLQTLAEQAKTLGAPAAPSDKAAADNPSTAGVHTPAQVAG